MTDKPTPKTTVLQRAIAAEAEAAAVPTPAPTKGKGKAADKAE